MVSAAAKVKYSALSLPQAAWHTAHSTQEGSGIRPGRVIYSCVRQALGHVPIIAEDLGVITPDVVALREAIGAPGMVVLQATGPASDQIQGVILVATASFLDCKLAWCTCGQQAPHLNRFKV